MGEGRVESGCGSANVPDVSETYAKLFSSILRSSIWTEPLETKIVWITMLALADRHGYVGASIPGIASAAGVPLDKAAEAIAKFLAPDEWSRSKDFDGRRIEEADRGWTILNYERFRDMRDEEARKEYERNRKRESRKRKNVPDSLGTSRDSPGQTTENAECPAMSAHAEASTSTEGEKAPRKRGTSVDEVEKPDDVMAEVWDAWMAVRKRKRAPLTKIAWSGVLRETAKAGWHINEVVRKMAERNWQSVEADWLAREQGTARKVTANGRPVVEASTMHIPNMPLGHESCGCEGCLSFRRNNPAPPPARNPATPPSGR